MRNYPKKKEKKHTFIHLYISELPHFNGKKKIGIAIFFIDNKQNDTYHPLSGFDC